jgi:phosphatidylglycerol:prolipoprotein diacylglycerol transferase
MAVMHPILFRIPLGGLKLPWIGELGSVPIYSYGVMLGLSLVVGWYLTLSLAERDGLPRETMANNYVITAVAAVVSSRLLYILTNLSEFDSLGDVFSLREGGLVAYGGFLGGYLGSWAYLRLKRIRLMPWADVAVPSLASGLLITRIGCYLYGCDYGRPLGEGAPGWLAKIGTFPHWPEGTLPQGTGAPAWFEHVQSGLIPPDAAQSLPVHPTQIYESLVGGAILVLLLWYRRHQRFRGEIFFLFTFAYGTARFLLELVRADPERGAVPPSLPEHLLIPASLLLLAVGYSLSFARRIEHDLARRASQAASFLPFVLAYVALRPPSFGASQLVQLSTSQFIALVTGCAVCIAHAIFYRTALGNPTAAMALELPPGAAAPGGAADGASMRSDDEHDEDDEQKGAGRAAKRGKAAATAKRAGSKAATGSRSAKAKADRARKPTGQDEESADAASDEAPSSDEAPPSGERGDDDSPDDDEPGDDDAGGKDRR